MCVHATRLTYIFRFSINTKNCVKVTLTFKNLKRLILECLIFCLILEYFLIIAGLLTSFYLCANIVLYLH